MEPFGLIISIPKENHPVISGSVNVIAYKEVPPPLFLSPQYKYLVSKILLFPRSRQLYPSLKYAKENATSIYPSFVTLAEQSGTPTIKIRSVIPATTLLIGQLT